MEHIYFSNINEKIANCKWIGQGATANCYKSDDNMVYKLFKDNDTLQLINDKLFKDDSDRFSSITNNSFQAPTQIIINHNDELLGYSYPYIEGKTIDKLDDNITLKEFFCYYRDLLYDIEEISKKNFYLSDTHRSNIIFDETFHIFDLDCCRFVSKWRYDMLYAVNSSSVFKCIINSIFNKPFNERIVFFDPILNQLYEKICCGDVKNINAFLDCLSSLCYEDINPTIYTLRHSIKTRNSKTNTLL